MDGVFMENSTDQNNNKMVDGIHLKKGRVHHRNKLDTKRMKYKDDGVHHEDHYDSLKNKISSTCCSGYQSPTLDGVTGVSISADENTCLQSSPSLSHGSVSVCGRRRTMEDTVTIAPGFLSTECEAFLDFFAVYDGHGGAGVAHVCKDRLHRVLAKKIEEVMEDEQENDIDWDKVLEASFLKMDDEVDEKGTQVQNMKSIGSTALVALVERSKVIVANCGDSRAVLSRGGVAVPLSYDHKPDRPDELERVEAAGGRVINWNGYRVLGVLATSRSIGDQYLKPYVTSTPEISITERTQKDEFIILASDGLWDVMSNEFACQVVRKCLHGRIRRKSTSSVQGSSAAEAAAVLTELAMARGSKDNISVVVIELNKLQ